MEKVGSDVYWCNGADDNFFNMDIFYVVNISHYDKS